MPGDVFEEGRGAGIPDERLAFLMMHQDDRQIGQNGIRFRGGNYWADAMYGIRERVHIRFDLADASRILVYDRDWRFLAEAHRVEAVHPLYHILDGEEQEAAKAIIAEQSKKHNSLKKSSKKIVRMVAKDAAGLGEEETVYAGLTGVRQLPAPVREAEPEPIEVEAEPAADDQSGTCPKELWGQPLEMVVWYEKRHHEKGLTADGAAHLTALLEGWPWLIGHIEDRERDYGISGAWITPYLPKERRRACN